MRCSRFSRFYCCTLYDVTVVPSLTLSRKTNITHSVKFSTLMGDVDDLLRCENVCISRKAAIYPSFERDGIADYNAALFSFFTEPCEFFVR